ncbi:MAG: hypothetical protein PHW83_13605, partial [Bacteroidales bacterium]|nr:hypothetical protein [Bacteroidales bacterium]
EINFGLISFYDNDASSLSKPELLYGIGIRYQNDLKGGFVRFKYEYCNSFNLMPGLSIGYNF